jgi:hypothetical protein
MDDTFLLTNISPQNANFNRGTTSNRLAPCSARLMSLGFVFGFCAGYWAGFERLLRHFTRSYDHVFVVTGPLFLPTTITAATPPVHPHAHSPAPSASASAPASASASPSSLPTDLPPPLPPLQHMQPLPSASSGPASAPIKRGERRWVTYEVLVRALVSPWQGL